MKTPQFEYYYDHFSALIKKLYAEQEEKKSQAADGGVDAIFEYAAEYVQQCDIISCLEFICDLTDEEIVDIDNYVEIPIGNIEYLLSDGINAFDEINKRLNWRLDNDIWQEFRSSVRWAIKKAFQKGMPDGELFVVE